MRKNKCEHEKECDECYDKMTLREPIKLFIDRLAEEIWSIGPDPHKDEIAKLIQEYVFAPMPAPHSPDCREDPRHKFSCRPPIEQHVFVKCSGLGDCGKCHRFLLGGNWCGKPENDPCHEKI